MTPNQKPPVGAVLRKDGHWSVDGLVGCWLFNEGGGSKAVDLCQKSHGTVGSGAILGLKGLTGNGATTACVSTSNIPTMDMAKPYSIVISFVVTSFASTQYLWSKGDWDSGQYIEITTSGRMTFIPNQNIVGVDGVVSLNVPTNICWVVNGASTTQLAYKNGVRLAGFPSSVGGFSGNSSGTIIGGYPALASLNGSIFSTFIYNRALSADEIKSLHENPYQMCTDRPNVSATVPATTFYGSTRRR